MANAHVLIADITGSTALYDQMANQRALDQISRVLARMRSLIADHGGHCVKSQGDDTLSFFSDADAAFAAARAMIETPQDYGLAIHAGLCFGEVLSRDADIYGDAVNTAARLASLAKPGEMLISETVHACLGLANRSLFVTMGGIKLKGKRAPTRVHSFAGGALETQTILFGARGATLGRRTLSADLNCGAGNWSLSDGDRVTVGRAPDCAAVLDMPWVSRQHGSFELRTAQLEYTDHSSSGSTVVTSDGREYALQRRSMLLNGEGLVLVGTRDQSMEGSIIRFATNDLVPDAG